MLKLNESGNKTKWKKVSCTVKFDQDLNMYYNKTYVRLAKRFFRTVETDEYIQVFEMAPVNFSRFR